MDYTKYCLKEEHFGIIKVLENWLEIADNLGYESITEMLYTLYVIEEKSLGEMSKIIGKSKPSIKIKLEYMGIELRPRGGAHYIGEQKTKAERLSELADNWQEQAEY